MAGPVRLYGPSTGTTPGITPSASSGWVVTAQMVRRVPSTSKTNTSLSTIVSSTSTSTVHLQWVYPLQTGIEFSTSDTIKGSFRYQTASSFQTQYSAIAVRVIASDGTTVRATLYALAPGSQGGVEISTSASSRKIPQEGPKNLQANYTTVAGDYLVIEIGAGQTAGASGNVTLTYGDPSATADLADADSNTTNNVPWIEFSNDILTPATVSASATMSSGTMTFTGKALTGASAQALATVSDGTLTLTGQAMAAARYAVTATVAQGTLTLTGKALTGASAEGYAALPSAATLTLIGQDLEDASWDAPDTAVLSRGTLTFTGKALTKASAEVLALVDGGTLALVGQDATGRADVLATVAQGTLTINGQSLLANAILSALMTRGTLTMTGKDFAVSAAASTTIARGTLTMTGVIVIARQGFSFYQVHII